MSQIIVLVVIGFFAFVAACGDNIHPAKPDADRPGTPVDAFVEDAPAPTPDAPPDAAGSDQGSGSGSGHRCGDGDHHHHHGDD